MCVSSQESILKHEKALWNITTIMTEKKLFTFISIHMYIKLKRMFSDNMSLSLLVCYKVHIIRKERPTHLKIKSSVHHSFFYKLVSMCVYSLSNMRWWNIMIMFSCELNEILKTEVEPCKKFYIFGIGTVAQP